MLTEIHTQVFYIKKQTKSLCRFFKIITLAVLEQ